jgi:hypothetical protein
VRSVPACRGGEAKKRTVVAECSVKNGGKHKGLVKELGNPIFIGGDAHDAVLGKGAGAYDRGERQVLFDRMSLGKIIPSARRRMD